MGPHGVSVSMQSLTLGHYMRCGMSLTRVSRLLHGLDVVHTTTACVARKAHSFELTHRSRL